jgi:hypothetical protein
MTPPWHHPPEDQIVAVVHAVQELLVGVTDSSELRAVLDGTQGQAGRRWNPTGWKPQRERCDGRCARLRWVHSPRIGE